MSRKKQELFAAFIALLAVLFIVLSAHGQDRVMRRPLYSASYVAMDSLPNMFLWYKASTESYADNDGVSPWTDRSATAKNLTEATNKPTFKTSIINGLPVVRFDGTNDQLKTASMSWSAEYTVYGVINVASSPSSGVTNVIVAVYNGGNDRHLWIVYSNDGSGARLMARGQDTAHNNYDDWQAMTNNTWHVISVVRRSGDIQVYVDGQSDGATSSSGTNKSPTTNLAIAQNNFGGEWCALDMAELVFYSSAHGTTDRQNGEDSLGHTYGITITH